MQVSTRPFKLLCLAPKRTKISLQLQNNTHVNSDQVTHKGSTPDSKPIRDSQLFFYFFDISMFYRSLMVILSHAHNRDSHKCRSNFKATWTEMKARGLSFQKKLRKGDLPSLSEGSAISVKTNTDPNSSFQCVDYF